MSRRETRVKSPGHLHSRAPVAMRTRWLKPRCFASDGERAVVPAFGAYTGDLSIRDEAFAKKFSRFMTYVLGDSRLHIIAALRCY